MLAETTEAYLAELGQALTLLDRDAIRTLAEALMRARREGRQVLLMGNGGSASLASHMANDLNKLVVPGQARWRAKTRSFGWKGCPNRSSERP